MSNEDEPKKGRFAKLVDGAKEAMAPDPLAANQTAWEYRLDVAVMLHYDQANMSKHGAQGWEVAAVSWSDDHYPKSVLYKRPVRDDAV